MRHSTRSSLYATVAISAALAFGSTSASAQDAAAPTIEVPQAAPAPAAPAPQPTIVLPQTTAPAAETPAEEPAAKSSPTPRAERAAPRPAARAAARSAEPAAPQPASAPAEQAAPVAPAVSEPVAAAPVAAAEPFEPEPAADPRQEDSVRSSVDLPDELLVAMGLGVIALGGIGLYNMRRRRREQALYDETYEPAPEYVAEEPVTSIPEELAVHPAQPVPAMTANGQSFVVPEGPVPTGEARQQLIDAMVAAPPDEANPFTSLRARRKRARIILQSREHELHDQATQPFDWRTYKSPAGVDPATPPKVDA